MKRLLENELLYGRLLPVCEPHLVERYNKALQAFGLPATGLEAFDIDRTGFSPQVADEIGDPSYLDPNDVNRRFIILTPEQASLPVVHTAFSNTSQLMYEFFAANERAIHALTIKDVVYGEIEDNVNDVVDIEDLLSINQVEFRVLSGDDLLAKAAELRRLSDRLVQEPHAWQDDDMIARMVELAKAVGDIRTNPLTPEKVVFRHDAFWTRHFGGVYVFLDKTMTTVICDPSAPGFRRSRPWQVSYLSIDDASRVHSFLASTNRIELPRASWIEKSGFIEHRQEMIVRDLVWRFDPESKMGRSLDPVWVQTWIHNHAGLVEKDGRLPFLNAARRELANTGRLDPDEMSPRERMLLCTARPDHPDAWLTNRLISDFVPEDFISRYVFNKQGFYRDYEEFDERRRQEVVETLKATYLKDKAAFRARLYGLTD